MAVTANNNVTVAPDATVTTNSYVAIGAIDLTSWQSLAFTIKASTSVIGEDSSGDIDADASIKWTVHGANVSDYSDEVTVQAEATVVLNAVGSYAVAQAPFRYYRVKIKSAVNDTPGTALVNGIAKP